jgi:hypothetical protein
MNRPLLQEKLDVIESVLGDLERVRRAAIRLLVEDRPALAVAQVDLLCEYTDALVHHACGAQVAAGHVGMKGGVLACLP